MAVKALDKNAQPVVQAYLGRASKQGDVCKQQSPVVPSPSVVARNGSQLQRVGGTRSAICSPIVGNSAKQTADTHTHTHTLLVPCISNQYSGSSAHGAANQC
eukprot:1162028-Pelagomonas_calceolata.AAC.14